MKKLISLFALAAASIISINAQNVKMHRGANDPSGTVYDPEGDGTPLQSLGVAEHWNNAKEKKYTKIELIYKAR